MCRKLLCLVVLMSMASLASAQLIDNFESYWGTPAMLTPLGPWYDGSEAGASSDIQLVIGGGAAEGNQHQYWEYTVDGGWADPQNPTDYGMPTDHAFTTVDFAAPMQWTANTRMHISLRKPAGDSMVNFFLLEWNADNWSQTWIPANDHGVQYWFNPDNVPGVVLNEGEIFPDWGGVHVPGYQALPTVRSNEGWVELVVAPNMTVDWGASDLIAMGNVYGVSVGAWTQHSPDSSGASGDFKTGTDGTTIVWPNGPTTGDLEIDNIWFEEIPEPMTIGLLGLGGLALIRRKR